MAAVVCPSLRRLPYDGDSQTWLTRSGQDPAAAATVAAAAAAAAVEAKEEAEAVVLPDADFWRRAAGIATAAGAEVAEVAEAEVEWGGVECGSEWAVRQLVEQWRSLGPMARKRVKRRMLHSLDRWGREGFGFSFRFYSGLALSAVLHSLDGWLLSAFTRVRHLHVLVPMVVPSELDI
jgi:hypothetical protein